MRGAAYRIDSDHTRLYTNYVSPRIRKLYSFPIEADLAAALKAIKARDGISEAEQIRRGIRLWLESKGVIEKAERKRAGTRKRP